MEYEPNRLNSKPVKTVTIALPRRTKIQQEPDAPCGDARVLQHLTTIKKK